MSNKVRVVMIEADGSDAVMSQALAGFLRALDPASEAASSVLPLPVVEEPRALPAAPVKRAAHKYKPRRAPVPAARGAGGAADAGTRGKIIAALGKLPMTSGDVAKATGLKQSLVYSTLHILRKEGVVESRESEQSLYPMQHLVKR